MGWLGGLGQGMVSYADTLKNQREMDWKAKQSEVEYQRQLNLERLRKQNNMELAQQQREWKQEDYATQRADKLTDVESQRTYQDKVRGEEREYQKTKTQEDAQLQLDTLEKKLTMTRDMEQSQRDEVANQYEKILSEDGSLDTKDQLMLLSIRTGQGNLQNLLKSEKPISADMLEKLDMMLSSDDKYNEADAATKIEMAKAAYRELQGGGQSSSPSGLKDKWNSNVDKLVTLAQTNKQQFNIEAERAKASLGEAGYNKLMEEVNNRLPNPNAYTPKGKEEQGMMSKVWDATKKFASGETTLGTSAEEAALYRQYKKDNPYLKGYALESGFEKFLKERQK